MGHSSLSVGKLRTPGGGLTAKAPSLRKDQTKGTQRTRKLSTGKALWSWRNGKERFVRARRGTAGAKPYTMKVVRTVFNGGHEETYGNATRLVPTQPHLTCTPLGLATRGERQRGPSPPLAPQRHHLQFTARDCGIAVDTDVLPWAVNDTGGGVQD